jgi:hypothetical protein
MVAVLLAVALPVTAQDISVMYNGRALETSAPPVEQNGRVLVAMRDIFEAMSASLAWDAASQTVTATHGSTEIVLTIGSTTAYVDSKAVALDVAAQLIDERTFVPLRFVAESTGAKVAWVPATRTVAITTGSGDGVPPQGSSHAGIPAPTITSPRPKETVGPAVDVVGRTAPGSAIRIYTYVYTKDGGHLVSSVPGILHDVPANGGFSHRIALPANRDYPPQALYYDIYAWTVIGGEQSRPTVVRVYRK